jgi:hypothetical protein
MTPASAADNDDEKRAWGLIAARLGRKAHRNDFIARFWAFKKKNQTADGGKEDGHKGGTRGQGYADLYMDAYLDAIADEIKRPAMSWPEAVTSPGPKG